MLEIDDGDLNVQLRLMTRNDNYSGDVAVATLLALGYTLYLVYIETSTVLPPRHQSPHPIAASRDVSFRTLRSPLCGV